MKITLNSWKQRLMFSARRRRLAKRATACLAVSLATAWAAPSQATTIRLEVSPAQDITNAWVGYLFKNTSSADWFRLGTLPGGQVSEFETEFPGVPESAFVNGPPGDPFTSAGYYLVGVYNEGATNGITASSQDDSPIVNGATWDSTFGQRFGSNDEQEVADRLAFWVINFQMSATKVLYGTEAVLVNYSTAAFGGTAIATIVPEPATWTLLVMGAGFCLIYARRRSG